MNRTEHANHDHGLCEGCGEETCLAKDSDLCLACAYDPEY